MSKACCNGSRLRSAAGRPESRSGHHRFPHTTLNRIAVVVALGLAALLPAGSLAHGAGVPQEIFVLAGQSNMVGEGLPLTLGAPTSPQLVEWSSTGWRTASDPLDPSGGIGPGMTFGLQLLHHQPGVTVGLVMCAVGGTSIAKWQPGGALYEHCISAAKAAGGKVSGILFLQGETDARRDRTAVSWHNGFRTMLAGWRRDLGTQPLFLLGQIGTIDPTTFPAQATVRAAQARAADADPTVCLVRTADLPNDGVHFTVPAYRVLGARFATAWWRAWERERAHRQPLTRTAAGTIC